MKTKKHPKNVGIFRKTEQDSNSWVEEVIKGFQSHVSEMSAPWGFKGVSKGVKTVGHEKVIVGVLKGFQRG